VDVFVGLEDANLVIWVLDGEAFDQGKLVLDLASFCLSLVLGFGQFLGGGVLFESDVVERHVGGCGGRDALMPGGVETRL